MEEKPMTILVIVILIVVDVYRAGGSLPGF